jgi:GxxExxY protein
LVATGYRRDRRVRMERPEPTDELDHLARTVIGAAIEVHRHLGPGYPESVYEEALCLELGLRELRFERQVAVAVAYKGVTVGYGRLDLLVERSLVVELKAIEEVLPLHKRQVVTYLKTTRKQLGLLINFNTIRLRDGINRLVNLPY